MRIGARILPMTNDSVRTIVDTDAGALPFQRYFVECRCIPIVRSLRFEGAARSIPSTGLLAGLSDPAARAVVICPSNPYLSIDPILAVPGVRDAIARASAPVVAVSPIIGGQAVKGPTVKIMTELGIRADNAAIAAHYHGAIDGLVVDEADAGEAAGLDIPVLPTSTLMTSLEDRERLARDVLSFAGSLSGHAALRRARPDASDGGHLQPVAARPARW
jgi:LPPG:FO 2-phospho-L-lactate transferase